MTDQEAVMGDGERAGPGAGLGAEPGKTADQSTALPAFKETVDATGLACPLPILRAKKALATLVAGDVLRVITTDRGAVRDFQAFCKQTGNTLLAQIDETDRVTHYLERRVK